MRDEGFVFGLGGWLRCVSFIPCVEPGCTAQRELGLTDEVGHMACGLLVRVAVRRHG